MLSRVVLSIGVALALGVASVAAAAPADKPNTLTPAERKAGWRLLFDGKTTKGWRGYKKQEVPAGWQVIDGVLTLADKKAGDLITADQYDDFEFACEWRISPKGNSGIIYRVAETDGPSYVTGPEYQVLDEQGHADAKAAGGLHLAASLYDVYAPAKPAAKPAGEWNATRIVLKGSKVEHWLNGEKVVDADMASADWSERIAKSKWKSQARFAKEPKGFIALQDHGDRVEFRNLKVLVLSAKPKGAATKAK